MHIIIFVIEFNNSCSNVCTVIRYFFKCGNVIGKYKTLIYTASALLHTLYMTVFKVISKSVDNVLQRLNFISKFNIVL